MFNYTFLITIICVTVFNKSLVKLWGILDLVQFFYFLKFIDYPMPRIIYSSLEHYSTITLQEKFGFFDKYTTPEMLSRYRLEGQFHKQGISSFFILQMEAIIYIFMSSVLTYGTLTIAKLCMVTQKAAGETGKP